MTDVEIPYQVGKTFYVRFHDSLVEPDFAISAKKGGLVNGAPFEGTFHEVEMKITHVFTPFTLSAVMKVEYFDPRTQDSKVGLLKLFDRRFLNNEREEKSLGAWSLDKEHGFSKLVETGKAEELLRQWVQDDYGDAISRDPSNLEAADDEWKNNPAMVECRLQYMALELFETELYAYKIFKHLQGTHVPQCVAPVVLCEAAALRSDKASRIVDYHDDRKDIASKNEQQRVDLNLVTAIPGLLLEFVGDAFGLDQLMERVPQNDWKTVIDLVSSVFSDISRGAYRVDDIRPENALITAITKQVGPANGKAVIERIYKCRVVDFAIGDVRDSTDTDRDYMDIKSADIEARYLYDEMFLRVCREHEHLSENWLPSFEETPWDFWGKLSEQLTSANADWVWEMDARVADIEEEIICSKPASTCLEQPGSSDDS